MKHGERLPLRLALDKYPDDKEAWDHTDAWGVAPWRGRRRLDEGAGAAAHPLAKPYNPRAEALEGEIAVHYEASLSGRRPPAL